MTPKQAELLETIKTLRKKNGYTPSKAEIAATLGISEVRVWQQVRCLQILGAIKMLGKKIQIGDEIPYSERQLEIVKMFAKYPDATQAEIAAKLKISAPSLQENVCNLCDLNAVANDNGKVTVLDKTLG